MDFTAFLNQIGMRIFQFLIFLLFSFRTLAQDSVVVQVSVVDDQFQESIQRVAVTAVYSNGQDFKITGSNGTGYFSRSERGNCHF